VPAVFARLQPRSTPFIVAMLDIAV
jgi:hypothetical protein